MLSGPFGKRPTTSLLAASSDMLFGTFHCGFFVNSFSNFWASFVLLDSVVLPGLIGLLIAGVRGFSLIMPKRRVYMSHAQSTIS